MDHPALNLLDELLSVPCPSGREERLAAVVREHVAEMGYQPETDPAGNVLVRLPGADPDASAAVLAAHMDELAMTVTIVEPDGILRVRRSGGLVPFKIGEGPVEIVGDGDPVIGVLSMGSTHTGGTAEKAVAWSDVWIATGLSPQDLAEAGVRVGSTATPVREFRGPYVFGDPDDPLVAAWTFDDRAGVMTLLRLLESMKDRGPVSQRPLIIAFTVHEEGGCHGAKVLAHRERPEIFVAVDGCPIPPEAPLKLDGRPAVWSQDALGHFDQRLVQALCHSARDAGTELQVAVYEHAAGDASAAYAVGAVPRVAHVGHVRENSHGYEIARLSVFDNLLKTLVHFASTL
jgi:putative aminopeptidase FrvX